MEALHTEKLLHSKAFAHGGFTHTHKSFYTAKLLHTEALHTQELLHTEAFTQQSFYTEKFFGATVFAHRSF